MNTLIAALIILFSTMAWAFSLPKHVTPYGLTFSVEPGLLQYSQHKKITMVPIYHTKGYDTSFNHFYYTANVLMQADHDLAQCYAGPKQMKGLKKINGVMWHTLKIQNVGMSHLLVGTSYRIIRKPWCIKVTFVESGAMLSAITGIKQIRQQAAKQAGDLIESMFV